MNQFHVLLATVDKPEEFHCFAHDLSEKELKASIVKRYNLAKPLMAAGRILPVQDIRGIKIIRTESDAKTALAAATDELNRELESFNSDPNSGVVFMPSLGYGVDQIADVGVDVTLDYVKKAPGEGGLAKGFNLFLSHPWVAGIGTAILAALFIAWLKL